MCKLKKCCKCSLDKSVSEFSKNKAKKDGLASVCKNCHKEYRHQHYLENKSKVLKQVGEYRNNDTINKSYLNKYESLKKHHPNITINHIKSNRIHPVVCCVCDKEYFKSKKDVKENNFCSSGCVGFFNFNPFVFYLQNVVKRSKKKGYECDLDSEYLKELFDSQNGLCGMTGVPINLPNKKEETKIYETASLDRIDNKLGYIKGNVRWVVLGINYMKNRHSDEDLIILINKIKESYLPGVQKNS